MIYILPLNLINLILNVLFLNRYLHLYQLKDYNTFRYLSYFKNKKIYLILFNILLLFLSNIINDFIFIICINIFSIIFFNIFNWKLIKNSKTPIKYTGRIVRIYLISSILLIFPIFLNNCIIISNLLLMILPILSNLLNIYDHIRNKLYINSAKNKLKKYNTKIIAITGSNGKTSVKNILLEILLSKYRVQATPKSFNTPLGISRFINNELRQDTEYLILEYGARHRGDVRKLCRLYGANFGIITTIAPQHLQTFHNIENIYLTKKELSDYLNDKLCVYNLDNLYSYRMYNEKQNSKLGISLYSNSDLTARNVNVFDFTTHFTLYIHDKPYNIQTKLLGKHNITNILLASALAINLGVPIDKIINSITNLKPTPHRLEYISGRLHILDDSYNCSLASAKEALDVLRSTLNKKMIITPGIIEGGKSQYQINYKLGQMCSFVDYFIIIGNTNKYALVEGYQTASSSPPICANTLEDAKKLFTLLSPNDTILLLNDLPDDYD